MEESVNEYMTDLTEATAEKERINTELSLAARIQRSMLTTEFPERAEFRVHASMEPAKEVGGDFSQAEQITHTGALLVGTYDNFTDGDPVKFLKNLNRHMPGADQNDLIFIEQDRTYIPDEESGGCGSHSGTDKKMARKMNDIQTFRLSIG